MEINTTRFGTIHIEEDKIIHMPLGMLGFPHKTQYVMLQHRENSPFYWYQSVEDASLAFVIASPYLFTSDYEVDVEDVSKEMAWDGDEENNELELYVVVNIPRGSPERMTANLMGPLLINGKTRQAVQMVISDSPYSHRFPILSRTGQ